jgi:hypothetical protein
MILRNRLKTPDGTIIESWHRHDYVTHKDANGKTYMVDGGRDYLRRSAHGDEEDLSIVADPDEHDFCRQHFLWGTYGKDGEQPFRRVVLADMSTEHIKAVLRTQTHLSYEIRRLFENELLYRERN